MKKNPPHLPPESCSLHLRSAYVSVKNLILFVTLALLAGIAGALAVSAWIEPAFYNTDYSYILRDNNTLVSDELPDVYVLQRYRESVLSLYEADAHVDDAWYTRDAFVASAVMLTSDGWAVVSDDALSSRVVTSLLAVDNDGNNYKIERALHDTRYAMTYIKFVGNNFHVLPFASWQNIDAGIQLWSIHDKTWRRRVVGDSTPVVDEHHYIYDEYAYFSMTPAYDESGILVSNQGQFVGFVNRDNSMQSAWAVSVHIAHILGDGVLAEPLSLVEGRVVTYMDDNEDLIHVGRGNEGFLVTALHGDKTGLRVGDIVIAVDNNIMDITTLYDHMFDSQSSVLLTVWRNGEEFDILVNNET